MPGFSNTTLYANNVDFSGSAIVTPQIVSDGQLLIGSSTAPNIRVNTLTQGPGISITNGHGSITISATGTPGSWTVISIDQTMATGGSYGVNAVAPIILTLPSLANIGDTIAIQGMAGGWSIAQNAGQYIRVVDQVSSVGTGGSIASTTPYDGVRLVCLSVNNGWFAISSMGNLTII